jgi:hypothetical protein
MEERGMPYVYLKVDDLDGTKKVGSKQCVALLQHYAHLPVTSAWREGKAVAGDYSLAKGTAIATFVEGKYQSHTTGNHAAFYLRQDGGGIWVMDQWADDRSKPSVSERYLRRKGTSSNGRFVDPSNNADAYSVIE